MYIDAILLLWQGNLYILKGLRGIRIYNFVNFENVIDISYIAQKRRNFFSFQDVYCHVNKLVYIIQHIRPHETTNTDRSRRHDQSNHMVTSIPAALNWSGNAMIGRGAPPQHRLSAQRWADQINIAKCCRNIQPSISRSLGIQTIYLGFPRIQRNVDKQYFKKSKNSERNKIMICGIHCFTTKLKTKIYVIPRSRFNYGRF